MLSWPVSLTVFFVSKAMMSLKTSLAGAATAIGLTALAYPAQAAQFAFSYTHGGPTTPIVVTGILEGNLITPDIIDIIGFSNLVYNGVSLASDPMVWQPGMTSFDSWSNANIGDGALATASFSGNSMNFVLFGEAAQSEYIAFGPSGGATIFTSSLTMTMTTPAITGDLMGMEETFSQPGWNLQLIPEPGAVVGLLGLGLGALASKVIKKG
ncbi:hypothetical protein MiYa_04400 [Microcystis aeruginosa NIES-2519]|uniref:PEP-CTERM protein-sorting domain-containing protein n=1 Tax=Microcystis aeruginosa NIES-2519 TaxID=2303981 RepID=A0A5A5RD16_MICAE|nr:PEP-CTERM sorting domain-containing protein [Microcystis aeruginosa]GCA72845.1 hypothetical protein MiYa_04400 [Microcystis aeruginosa NIES-2519]